MSEAVTYHLDVVSVQPTDILIVRHGAGQAPPPEHVQALRDALNHQGVHNFLLILPEGYEFTAEDRAAFLEQLG